MQVKLKIMPRNTMSLQPLLTKKTNKRQKSHLCVFKKSIKKKHTQKRNLIKKKQKTKNKKKIMGCCFKLHGVICFSTLGITLSTSVSRRGSPPV